MRATISLDSLRETIRSTSIDNQRWLLDKLQNNIDNMCNVVAEDRTEYISKQEILEGVPKCKFKDWAAKPSNLR